MTFEQLAIFVAVAEREHLTHAAEAIHLTPSAVSTAIKNLEAYYGVELFHRVGRRIELTETGRTFLDEARATLARVNAAELMLSELGGLQRGRLTLCASQTIASYWLPPVMMRFHRDYPGIDLDLMIGNTRTVSDAVIEGRAELGFVEGELDAPVLSSRVVAQDALALIVAPDHPWADGRLLSAADLVADSGWVMREEGSGTRSEFENAIERLGVSRSDLQIALTLPSNEAVLAAVRSGPCAAVISSAAAALYLQEGLLVKAAFDLPVRNFRLLRHKERHASKAALTLEAMCRTG
ncbi:LysR family transcriptional regulator [Neorhizobium sp. P12A]|jgi:DNA-binding transcriptional LysR family regulator|uniref:LysR substrate-binding domain-containing protein n=1 Tax=Rhizobium/Agrobacterium group TaxID=227290 RepID=UPI00104A1209|nr:MULTISPECIES: LysR substrate-binding domain-containing protein [Rhizobium/Agrobacterium group]KAA0700767.1 LysR family transcriptional regulator [Neorhizobium sp. P12A]TCR91822.1 LysR family transcriptional regulator [Rhizobium sp. BK376]